MRLTCPSVWYKRILLSRTQVEQSYSHGLRRWAGYQRFLLEMDDGRSPEPFRQTLEVMIKDAEKKAGIIDDVIRNVGNTHGGVLNRISEYESQFYKPHRHEILRQVEHWKQTERSLHDTVQSHRGHESHQVVDDGPDKKVALRRDRVDEQKRAKVSPRKKSLEKRKYQSDINKLDHQQQKLAQAAKEIQEEWAILQRERTKFLAENLITFVDRLAISGDRGDEDGSNHCLLTEPALELSFQKLQPRWKEEIDNSLHDLFSVGGPEGTFCDNESGSDSRTREERTSLKDGPSELNERGGVKCEEKKVLSIEKVIEKQPSANAIKFPKVEKQPPRSRRYPTSVTTLEARPLAPRESVRWSDMGPSSVAKTPTSNFDIIRKYVNRGQENCKATSLDDVDHPRGDVPSLPLRKMETCFKVVKVPATASTQTHSTEGTQTRTRVQARPCQDSLSIGSNTGGRANQHEYRNLIDPLSHKPLTASGKMAGHFLPGLSATRSGPLLQFEATTHESENPQTPSEQGEQTTLSKPCRCSKSKREGLHFSAVEKKLREKSNTLRLPSLNIPSIALHNSLEAYRNQ